MNKKLVIALFSIMLVVVLAACNNTNDSGAEQTDKGTTPNNSVEMEGYTLPIVTDGSVTLTLGIADNYYLPKSYTQGLPIWNAIEQRTGVKINWDVTPSTDFFTVWRVRVSANQKLPDILQLPIDPIQAATDKLIIPLNDLIDQYAPNIKKLLDDYPDIRKAMTMPDGYIYTLSSVQSGNDYSDPYGPLIRQDWLDKVGLPEPKTLDDWYTVLKAFKEKDPNENGKPDEIPLSPLDFLRNGIGFWGNALNLHLAGSDGYYPDENGKIQWEWLTPEAHQLIEWFHKLYVEGLLDPEFAVFKYTDVVGKISRDLVGATNGFTNLADLGNSSLAQAGIEANWQNTLPPSGPGNDGYKEATGLLSNNFAITKDSEHPEVAIKWLDYVFASDEGNTYTTYGIEGTSYEVVDGKKQFTDFLTNNPDGLSFNDALRSLGGLPNLPYIMMMPGEPLYQQPAAYMESKPELKAMSDKVADHVIPRPVFGLATAEEAEQMGELMADLRTYFNETLIKFINGQEPIDWDKWVSTNKSMGIDKVLEIKQKQYDRANK